MLYQTSDVRRWVEEGLKIAVPESRYAVVVLQGHRFSEESLSFRG